jgi:hypothetical protein
VHARNRYAAFADRSGAAFHRSGAHIAGGENTGQAGLKRTRRTRAPFPRRRMSGRRPVLIKPFSFRSIWSGNQSVHGFAPIMEKIAGVLTTRRSRVCVFSSSTFGRRHGDATRNEVARCETFCAETEADV